MNNAYNNSADTKRRSFKLGADDRERLSALSTHYRVSWSEVIRAAVRRLHAEAVNANPGQMRTIGTK